MSSSGIIGSVEGGALRRRIHLEKARLLYVPSPGARRTRPSRARFYNALSSPWNSIILQVTDAANDFDRR